MLATLSLFAAIAPQASADTDLPVWGCRGSAAYVEIPLLLGETRVEPILANGFPMRGAAADNEQCVNAEAGATDVSLLPAGGGLPGAPPLVELNGAFARTTLTPPLGDARDQDVLSEGGVTDPLRIVVAGITIQLDAVNADATGTCLGTEATLDGTSTIVNLRINGLEIPILNGVPSVPIALAPLVEVAVNQQLTSGTPGVDESLTQQALRVTVLGLPLTDALATVVVGEAKVFADGDVCAAAPPPTTCPVNTVPVPNSDPLVCQLTVIQCAPGSAPNPNVPNTCVLVCPAGSTAGTGGACVITTPCGAGTTNTNGVCVATPTTCPAGTTREPTTNTCVLLVQRPCPTGSTPDPATRVCVLRVPGGTTVASSGQNGGIGSADGPRPTCGRLAVRFVRGTRNFGSSFTSRFGNRTVTRGTLVTCGSNPRPIVGARIDVVHILPGNKRRRKTGLRSRAAGKMTLILPVDLKTRRIEYAYRPNLNTSRVTSRRTLTLTVRNKAGRILR